MDTNSVPNTLRIWFFEKGKPISESVIIEELKEGEKWRINNVEKENDEEIKQVYRIEKNNRQIYIYKDHYYIPLPIIEEMLKAVYKLLI